MAADGLVTRKARSLVKKKKKPERGSEALKGSYQPRFDLPPQVFELLQVQLSGAVGLVQGFVIGKASQAASLTWSFF